MIEHNPANATALGKVFDFTEEALGSKRDAVSMEKLDRDVEEK